MTKYQMVLIFFPSVQAELSQDAEDSLKEAHALV
jgi:hypothetical protein